jgi:hypothetical protein
MTLNCYDDTNLLTLTEIVNVNHLLVLGFSVSLLNQLRVSKT